MSIKALQDYTFVSRYARYDAGKKRRETWSEAVDRVKQMHLRKYPQVREDIDWAFQRVEDKRALGSQRALQFGGAPIEKHNARIYNCTVSFCDRLRFFQEAFWLLLCGSGVGFSVQKHHVDKMPELTARHPHEVCPVKKYTIPDSIEGWADALGVLLSSYFDQTGADQVIFPEYADSVVKFDYSQVRAAGSPLNSCSGKAPGPEPLRNALERIRNLLDRCVANGQSRLRTIDAYDVIMHASDAVLSGGVRRSATICIFSPDDEDMMHSKVGNWFYENPQRARSNNSVLLLRDKTTPEQFKEIMQSVQEFGEPGFLWSDSTEYLVNPCVEIGFWPVDPKTLKSGWAFCNLSELNGGKIKTKEDFREAVRAAAIIGTLQAGYDKFPYLGETTENIVRHEALLGVSITGVMENPAITLDPETQREMAQLVLDVNAEMAPKIGVNLCARGTCIKPAGTSSCILGTSSGIHPHHWRRYLRRIQNNKMEAPFQHFYNVNPMAVEDSVWSANKTDGVITFCVEVPDDAYTKREMSAVELLSAVKTTQQNWVLPGTRKERCVKPWLTHNVSNTINVRADEWDRVTDFIYDNRRFFAGISLLPETGDLDYQQAPMVAILEPDELVAKYGPGSIMASGLIVDGLAAFENNLWLACDAARGLGEYDAIMSFDGNPFRTDGINLNVLKNNIKKDWIRRARQFAKRYFEDDVKKMCYCLKQVSLYKTWLDLRREYKEVDYTLCHEDEDNTHLIQESGCSGGACQVI